MFLRNYYLALAAATLGTGSSSFGYAPKDTSGNRSYYMDNPSSAIKFGNTANNNYYDVDLENVKKRYGGTGCGGVIFGTGTTPPTIDDYCLSGDIVSTFSYSSSVKKSVDNGGVTYTATYTLTNTSDEDITIGEVAMICSIRSTYGWDMLLERTVLDEPLTIPAGGIGQVTYTVRQNLPLAG